MLATTFEVTTIFDSGPGSLRAAVADAAIEDGKDEIVFAEGLFTSGTPVISLNNPIAVHEPVKIHSEFGAVVIQNGGSVQEALFLRPSLGQGISEDFEISDLVFEDSFRRACDAEGERTS